MGTVRVFIGTTMQRFLDELQFADALPGYRLPDVASQRRVPIVVERVRDLISISKG